MSFETLVSNLSELEGLMKSLEAAQTDGALDDEENEDEDDAAIAAAAGGEGAADGAAEGASDDPAAVPDAAEAEPDDEDEEEGVEPLADDEDDEDVFGKSFAIKTVDGAVVQAVDGAAALRALQSRMARRDEVMSKALASITSVLKQQAELIKSLRAEVARGGMAGRGRKAVLTVHDKPAAGTLQKSQPAGVSAQEFLLKALDAQRAGRITGVDVAIAEAALNAGQQVPQHIAAKVLG